MFIIRVSCKALSSIHDMPNTIRDKVLPASTTRLLTGNTVAPAGIGSLAPGLIRVAPLLAVPGLLATFGVDPAGVFAEFGLPPNVVDDPDTTIAYADEVRLLARCAEVTGCRHFGLLVGQRAGASTLGIPGYLAMNSADVNAALRQFVDHLNIHDRGGVPYLATDHDFAFLGYTACMNPGQAEQITHCAIAIAFNLMREIGGHDWLPSEVRFAFPPPEDLRPFQRFFKAPVHFYAEQSTLVFPKRWLKQPVAGADPALLRVLQGVAETLRQRCKADLVTDVRHGIIKDLSRGNTSIDVVARQLGMHPRTLNRRLKEKGTSFIHLLGEIRLEIASQLLCDRRLSITRIGLLVGYSSASAFTRSFQRQSGKSPKKWRSSQLSGDAENRPGQASAKPAQALN